MTLGTQMDLPLDTPQIPVYPKIAGHRRTKTSKQAARRVQSRTERAREQIMSLLDAHGALTADECAELLGYRILFMRPRMSELKKMGMVIESGIVRLSSEGANSAAFKGVTDDEQH